MSNNAVVQSTWIFYGVLCQTINVFGVITNGINIICFIKQGFNDSVNISLLGLSFSDLGSLITMIWTCICMTPAVAEADLSFDPLEVLYVTTGMTHLSFTRVSSCITAMITLERCMCIISPFKVKRIITPKRTAIATVCVSTIFFCSGSPVYAVNKLGMKFSATRNKTILGIIPTSDREKVESITFIINNFAIPFCAFAIIAICTTTVSIKLYSITIWRQKIASRAQIDKVSIRNQKTAKMVVMISVLFIVCFIPISSIMLGLGLLPELSVNGKYMHISLLIAGISYTMESINSSVNIFIYYHMSSKYRETFLRTFMHQTNN